MSLLIIACISYSISLAGEMCRAARGTNVLHEQWPISAHCRRDCDFQNTDNPPVGLIDHIHFICVLISYDLRSTVLLSFHTSNLYKTPDEKSWSVYTLVRFSEWGSFLLAFEYQACLQLLHNHFSLPVLLCQDNAHHHTQILSESIATALCFVYVGLRLLELANVADIHRVWLRLRTGCVHNNLF